MTGLTYASAMPVSSGEIQTLDTERALEIASKQRRIAALLEARGVEALVIQHPANFAWLTAGGDVTLGFEGRSSAAVFVTPDARVVLCNNIDSGRIFDKELHGLGFQLKERPWHEPLQVLIDDVCRGRRVASDTGAAGTKDVAAELRQLRCSLEDSECQRLRELGKRVTHAVEATARHFERGETEAEIAGQLAHRLIKHEVRPECLQVWADGRGHRYRNWQYGDARVDRYCTISAFGRRQGLCAAVTRCVSFGEPSPEVRGALTRALFVQATGIFFTTAHWEFAETWKRVERIYHKFGCPDEWRMAQQGAVIGYSPCEMPFAPGGSFELLPNMAAHWCPTVGPVKVGDSVLINGRRPEIITPAVNWPTVTVAVRRVPVVRPDMLRRELM